MAKMIRKKTKKQEMIMPGKRWCSDSAAGRADAAPQPPLGILGGPPTAQYRCFDEETAVLLLG